MSTHAAFSQALLTETMNCPPGLTTWNRSDPARRFSVYRNNVLVGLVDALADTYPVTQALVGESFFRAMAAVFVRAQPPSSPILAYYGKDFPEFVATFQPVATLPYLADLARLEYLRVEAYHAADASSLSVDDIGLLLADESALPTSVFSLHPSFHVLPTDHPVVSLWAAHQSDDPSPTLADIAMDRKETALVFRNGLDVLIMQIDAVAGVFLTLLKQGLPLGVALEQTPGDVDLPGVLGLLIQQQLIVDISALEPRP
jgi:hypothetical protein